MKSFIFALIVLLLVTAFVVFNSLYLSDIYDGLIESTDQLPDNVFDPDTHFEVISLCERANSYSIYLYTMLPNQNVNDLLICLTDMLSATYAKDESAYIQSVRRAELTLKLMKKNEVFSFIK